MQHPEEVAHCLAAEDEATMVARLQQLLIALPSGSLPLQHGCLQGGLIDDSDLSLSMLSSSFDGDLVVVRVGVFFTEVVGGCNCHDDPVNNHAYAVIEVLLDGQQKTASYRAVDD